MSCGLLGLVRMFGPTIDFQFAEDLSTEAVLREHAFHGMLNDALGILPKNVLEFLPRRTTRESRIMEILLQLYTFPGNFHFGRIDDDDKVAHVRIRCEHRFVFSTK